MALTMNKDLNTGIELDGLYYRIDKINFNDFDFQVVMTGYASQQAFIEGSMPIAQPRAYTWAYKKSDLTSVSIFEYAYTMIKEHDDFKAAEDVLEDTEDISEQKPDSLLAIQEVHPDNPNIILTKNEPAPE